MKYCSDCGQKLNESSKFCANCGMKISEIKDKKETIKYFNKNRYSDEIFTLKTKDINTINKQIELENNQSSIVQKSLYAAGFFALVIIIAILDIDGLPIHPSIVMISIFLMLSSLVIGYMFRSREKKLQALITGENLVAGWILNDSEKKAYVNYLFKNEVSQNKFKLYSIGVISAVVFGIFILIIDEGKFAMFLVLLGLLLFLSFFAFGMPYYYKYQNLKNDGKILIGPKYAYINGYFHNWDFPLSGIKKAKIINEPFYGLYIKYFYTDRTFTNKEELNIPASKHVDLQKVVATLMA